MCLMPGKSRFVVTWALALVVALALAAGCQQKEELSPSAEEFRRQTLKVLKELKPELAPLMTNGDNSAQVGDVLEKAVAQCRDKQQLADSGLMVLDSVGVVVATRYPAKGDPEKINSQKSAYDYSNYKGFAKVLRKGSNNHLVLYTSQGPVFVVCSPLEQDKKVLGAVCVGCASAVLGHDIPFTEDEFKAMDFN